MSSLLESILYGGLGLILLLLLAYAAKRYFSNNEDEEDKRETYVPLDSLGVSSSEDPNMSPLPPKDYMPTLGSDTDDQDLHPSGTKSDEASSSAPLDPKGHTYNTFDSTNDDTETPYFFSLNFIPKDNEVQEAILKQHTEKFDKLHRLTESVQPANRPEKIALRIEDLNTLLAKVLNEIDKADDDKIKTGFNELKAQIVLQLTFDFEEKLRHIMSQKITDCLNQQERTKIVEQNYWEVQSLRDKMKAVLTLIEKHSKQSSSCDTSNLNILKDKTAVIADITINFNNKNFQKIPEANKAIAEINEEYPENWLHTYGKSQLANWLKKERQNLIKFHNSKLNHSDEAKIKSYFDERRTRLTDYGDKVILTLDATINIIFQASEKPKQRFDVLLQSIRHNCDQAKALAEIYEKITKINSDIQKNRGSKQDALDSKESKQATLASVEKILNELKTIEKDIVSQWIRDFCNICMARINSLHSNSLFEYCREEVNLIIDAVTYDNLSNSTENLKSILKKALPLKEIKTQWFNKAIGYLNGLDFLSKQKTEKINIENKDFESIEEKKAALTELKDRISYEWEVTYQAKFSNSKAPCGVLNDLLIEINNAILQIDKSIEKLKEAKGKAEAKAKAEAEAKAEAKAKAEAEAENQKRIELTEALNKCIKDASYDNLPKAIEILKELKDSFNQRLSSESESNQDLATRIDKAIQEVTMLSTFKEKFDELQERKFKPTEITTMQNELVEEYHKNFPKEDDKSFENIYDELQRKCGELASEMTEEQAKYEGITIEIIREIAGNILTATSSSNTELTTAKKVTNTRKALAALASDPIGLSDSELMTNLVWKELKIYKETLNKIRTSEIQTNAKIARLNENKSQITSVKDELANEKRFGVQVHKKNLIKKYDDEIQKINSDIAFLTTLNHIENQLIQAKKCKEAGASIPENCNEVDLDIDLAMLAQSLKNTEAFTDDKATQDYYKEELNKLKSEITETFRETLVNKVASSLSNLSMFASTDENNPIFDAFNKKIEAFNSLPIDTLKQTEDKLQAIIILRDAIDTFVEKDKLNMSTTAVKLEEKLISIDATLSRKQFDLIKARDESEELGRLENRIGKAIQERYCKYKKFLDDDAKIEFKKAIEQYEDLNKEINEFISELSELKKNSSPNSEENTISLN